MPEEDTSFKTTLHTRFAIFLYCYRLETAMLTRRVFLDAADAERSVISSHFYPEHLLALQPYAPHARIPY